MDEVSLNDLYNSMNRMLGYSFEINSSKMLISLYEEYPIEFEDKLIELFDLAQSMDKKIWWNGCTLSIGYDELLYAELPDNFHIGGLLKEIKKWRDYLNTLK